MDQVIFALLHLSSYFLVVFVIGFLTGYFVGMVNTKLKCKRRRQPGFDVIKKEYLKW